MGKRAASLQPVCFTACLDVDQPVESHAGVLCSIENVVAGKKHLPEGLKSPSAKKQRCLELDQNPAPKPLDASFVFSKARNVLRQPPPGAEDAPIGREKQSKQLDDIITSFVESSSGKSVYVSGLPGTGKSHTVRKALQQLLSSRPDAATITWVNCMSISTASEVYAQIAASADGSSNFAPSPSSSTSSSSCLDDDLAADVNNCTSSSACSSGVTTHQQLVERLCKPPSSSSRPAPKSYRASRSSSRQQQLSTAGDENDAAASRSPGSKRSTGKDQHAANRSSSSSSSRRHIIVLDEIDNLAKKSHAELVQLFLLPQQPGLQLLLIGIANSIDLTERALPELKLRMASPQLLCFPAYSTQQLGCILAACMEALPTKLFEPAALELCARSVGTSSGDLRHALKACRTAVDELEALHKQRQQQQQQEAVSPAAAAAALPTVTARTMIGALQRLASVRSSHFGAQATSCIRSLPNQQQLLLYSLSVLCKPRDAATAEAAPGPYGRPAAPPAAAAADTSSLWKAAGSAVAHSSGSKKGAVKKLAGSAAGGSSSPSSQQVFVLSVGLDDAYLQYRQVCKLLSLPACSRAELQHMAELLSQMALVDILKSSPAAGSSSSSSSAFGGVSSGLKAGRAGGKGGLGGLGGLGGGRGLLAGNSKKLGAGAKGGAGGSAGSSGFGVGGGVCQSGEVRLSLRPSAGEVEAALQHNPALRCLVQK
ncbi:hypothetical protein OEZ85_001977 [Tetradesmus obliquus]|uniref:AAA+ ATPase domain-containing protein n=1 Tax=Tetradesmus obliquus TaxID=3088 RepID=A0ABY8U1S3_TETOB|nr:hypothetical protein OEZ85_001977 [Tetradesmus obliquus]